jgi:hypothetical protein
MMNDSSDEPVPIFAKKVKQHLEIHPKIKETYLNYRKVLFMQDVTCFRKKRYKARTLLSLFIQCLLRGIVEKWTSSWLWESYL